MREILFRGKRVDTGEWVYGNLNYGTIEIENIQDTYFISDFDVNPWDKNFYKVIPESVGQYTGLTANGKKIFEGDILDYFDTLYIVSWSDNLLTYIVTSVDEKKEYLFYSNKANMDCVYNVGNIHDNPELLEVKV